MEDFDFSYEYDNRYQIYNPDKPPKQVYFAAEPVPLENKLVAQRFSRELRVQTYWNMSRVPLIQRGKYWLPQIRQILKQNKIPTDFQYLSVVESMLLNVESPRGAGGFWQLLPVTARNYGLEVNDEVDERYHPIKSTHAACKYFKEAYRMFGDWTSVAASYNSGMFALNKAYRRQKKESFYKLRLNKQTAGYIFRVLAFKQLMEHPKVYGYKIGNSKLFGTSLKKVKVSQSITNLTEFAKKHGISYQTLKKHNPWILKNTLTIKKEGKTYVLLIPQKRELLAGAESTQKKIEANALTLPTETELGRQTDSLGIQH
jgi:hypothetical protein